MSSNPIALELNGAIKRSNPHVLEMLSKIGRRLFFPKGILSQSAEAKQYADPKFNATIGIATENLRTMHLPTVMSFMNRETIRPSEALTYAPSFGIPELRRVWKESIYQKNPSLSGKILSLPVVTNGITHGISVFADMFLDPDDVVIFPDKMWGNNLLIMSVRRDARIAQYAMFNEQGGFNLSGFEKTVRSEAETSAKIVVVLNFPNNPTGYTVSDSEGDRIADILKSVAEGGTHVIAVCDDAYFGLRYEDGAMSESLFARLCDVHPRLLAVKMDAATKEIFVWGLRVGFITYGTPIMGGTHEELYDALEKKTAGDIRGTISNVSHLGQSLVLKTIKSSEFRKEQSEKLAVLKQRAMRVKAVLNHPQYHDAWEAYPFNSGYFMCLKLKTVDAERLRVHLLKTYRVGLISTGKADLRVAFSSVDEGNIPELFDYIYKGIKDLERQ